MQKQSKAPLIILIFVLALIGFFVILFSMMNSQPVSQPTQQQENIEQPKTISQPAQEVEQPKQHEQVEDNQDAKQAAQKIYDDMLKDEHQAMRLLKTGSFTYFDNDWIDAFNKKLQTYWPENIDGMSRYNVCDTAYRDLWVFLISYENLLQDPLNPTMEKIEQQERADYERSKAKCKALLD